MSECRKERKRRVKQERIAAERQAAHDLRRKQFRGQFPQGPQGRRRP